MNKWTLALAVAGIISTAAVVTAEEAENQALTAFLEPPSAVMWMFP